MGFIYENDDCDDREQIKEKLKGDLLVALPGMTVT